MPQKILITISLFVLSVLVVAITSISERGEVERDARAQYLKAGDFELEYDGKPFQLSQLSGSPIIIYFGYTFCPDVCPVGLSTIREALLSSESFKDVPVLFITVDPQRDTTERLRDYTSFFHPNIKGLRGRVAQIDAVSAAYGTFYRFGSDKEEGSNEYTVDHSAYVYLLNADGELVRVLDHDVKSDEISELLHKLL